MIHPLASRTAFAGLLSSLALLVAPAAYAADSLPEAHNTVAAGDLPPAVIQSLSDAARRYAAFWDTGEPRFAEEALAEDFTDRTLPAGRRQGRLGPLDASAAFRQAVPDLHARIDELLLVGDRAVVRLGFGGHFTGRFGALQGDGRAISFRAVDIYRVRDGRITDNWHLEDNLELMTQLGAIKP